MDDLNPLGHVRASMLLTDRARSFFFSQVEIVKIGPLAPADAAGIVEERFTATVLTKEGRWTIVDPLLTTWLRHELPVPGS